jgi:hypothetical protein
MDTKFYKILAVIFVGIITFFAVMFIVSDKLEKDETENRELAKFPKLKLAKLDPFPSQFNKYFNDHFPYRSSIIKKHNQYTIKVLKISPIPKKAIIGDDGWLFMAGRYLDAYQGNSNFSNQELESIKQELVYRKEYCAKRGIKFYFVIIPQKFTIYPEYIATRYKRSNQQTPRTQLKEYLSLNQFPVYDLTDYLLENKSKEYNLFQKTDNHWTELGAFLGTQRIFDILRVDFPQIPKLTLANYNIVKSVEKGGNIAKMMNMKNEFLEEKVDLEPKNISSAVKGEKSKYKVPEGFPYGWDYEVVRKNPSVNNLKLLVIRESFCSSQVQFYKEGFGKSVFIFDSWQHKLNEDIIENEKPDIVVIQIIESMLGNLLKHQSRVEEDL